LECSVGGQTKTVSIRIKAIVNNVLFLGVSFFYTSKDTLGDSFVFAGSIRNLPTFYFHVLGVLGIAGWGS
jgi:hypothetical protein